MNIPVYKFRAIISKKIIVFVLSNFNALLSVSKTPEKESKENAIESHQTLVDLHLKY